MLQDSITLKNRHLKFIKNISENEIVYGLKSRRGFATSTSTQPPEFRVYAIIMMFNYWCLEIF